ncbi:MAG: AAA family ATPase [Desulfobacterales bacterium]|nr:AAA family ATPase [Desulfobacterales bacterium]
MNNNTYITKIELKNIRCFENFSADLEASENTIPLIIILGNNSAGKTTLLRSIALGLCNEGDAITLMKQVPGSFIREGEKQGWVKITLKQEKTGKVYTLKFQVSNLKSQVSSFKFQASNFTSFFPNQNFYAKAPDYGKNNLHS